jgi:hypothetical protein
LYDASVGVLDDLLATTVGRFNQRRALSLIIAGVSVLIALQFIASIGRSISKLLAELEEVTDRIGQGDLRIPTDIDGTIKLVSWPKRLTDCRQSYKAAIKRKPPRRNRTYGAVEIGYANRWGRQRIQHIQRNAINLEPLSEEIAPREEIASLGKEAVLVASE